MFTRTRRLRKSSIMREMVKNVTINLNQLVYPLFIEEGTTGTPPDPPSLL